VRSVAPFWTNTPLSSAIDAGSISVSTPLGKNRPVQNPIPIIWVTIIARLVWIICFVAGFVVNIEQEEAAFPSSIISVKNVKRKAKRLACLPQAGDLRIAGSIDGKGS